MDTVEIKVNDYYGKPSYYSVMPQAIFDALETAALNDQETVSVNRRLFDGMVRGYRDKMGL